MKNSNQWVKFRHKVVLALLRPFFYVAVRLKYGIRIEKFKEQGKRPYLILMNHQTGFDQFFVSLTFNRPIYFIASEDIFSMGWLSDALRYLVAPIPIRKQTTDLQAVKNCIRVAREGGSICIAPEGNRTFHGRTVYIKPSIASLAKKLGMPIAIFRIEDGYGVQPRWSDVVRSGKMRSYISRVIEPEEYKDMKAEELSALIEKELWVDEAKVTGTFRHKKNAEFLERVVYTCPWCGFAPFESNGDVIRCTKCDRKIRHLPTKELEGINCEFPHHFVADWYDWQNDYVRKLEVPEVAEPLFEDVAQLRRVHACKRKELLDEAARVVLYHDRIEISGKAYPFETLSTVTVLGKNKLNIYSGEEIFQLKGSKRFNALKYVNLWNHHQNIKIGEQHDEFLGL